MIRCKNCGTDNLDGSEYCDECGMRVDRQSKSDVRNPARFDPPAYQPPVYDDRYNAGGNESLRSSGQNGPATMFSEGRASRTVEGPPPTPPSFTTSTSIPRPVKPAMETRVPVLRPAESKPVANVDPPQGGQTLVLSSGSRTEALRSTPGAPIRDDQNGRSAKLVIERGGRVGREFLISGIETHIGRWDADSGIFPDVDLDQDDPEAKVSRRHARIVNQSGQYFIEDLGSTNGTFVNRGRRLLPGHRLALQNGDEIIVGKTFLKFHLVR